MLPASYAGGDCLRQVFYAYVTIAVSHGPVAIFYRWHAAVNGHEETGPTLRHTFAGLGEQSFDAVWRETGLSYDAAMAFRLDLLAPVQRNSPTLTASMTCTT